MTIVIQTRPVNAKLPSTAFDKLAHAQTHAAMDADTFYGALLTIGYEVVQRRVAEAGSVAGAILLTIDDSIATAFAREGRGGQPENN